MSLVQKYRPQTFDRVFGQAVAVKVLSGLARERAPRHLLLHGSFGSGKTSLVRLFARAINCENNINGSPCCHCASCSKPEEYCAEYDPGRADDKSSVRGWIEARNRTPRSGKFKVLFLDESQALQRAAMHSLLKVVEDAQPGVIFCFATTEPVKLEDSLKSRLLKLEVHPLTVSESAELLEFVAKEERIEYTKEALALLAEIERGHPRDLINALETVSNSSSCVDIESVKAVFGLTQGQAVVDYFKGLAKADMVEQSSAISAWEAGTREKVRSIRVFLTSLYYRDIRGDSRFIDALSHSITKGRGEILDLFCKRLGLQGRHELLPYWNAMMAFWSSADGDTAALNLKLALFEDFVNRLLPAASQTRGRVEDSYSTSAGIASDKVRLRSIEQSNSEHYLQLEDVRAIINKASFFVQHHGLLMNAAFKVVPSWSARQKEDTAIGVVLRFCAELERRFSQHSPFAYMALLDRNEEGVLGRVVACIPALMESSSCAVTLQDWCEAGQLSDEQDIHGIHCKLAQRNQTSKSRTKFHWDHILQLCAGIAADEPTAEQPPTLKCLSLPRQSHRTPGPIGRPPLCVSSLLTDSSISTASVHQMRPLSAFDDKAWTWIRSGWELNEHLDRAKEIEHRKRAIQDIEALWGGDRERCLQEIEKKAATWSQNPRNRLRSWKTWWGI